MISHKVGAGCISIALGGALTHDDSGETLGVVLGIAGVKSNRLQVQASAQVDSGHNVLQSRYNARSVAGGVRSRGRSSNALAVKLSSPIVGRWRGEFGAGRVRQAAWGDELWLR